MYIVTEMQLLQIYRGLNHDLRLRIICLLVEQPLSVGQLQQALNSSQVEISKQMAYLKQCSLVEVEKRQNFRIYRVPEHASYELARHLDCLRDCARNSRPFAEDAMQLKAIPKTLTRRRAKRRSSSRQPTSLREESEQARDVPEPLKASVMLEDHLL